MVISIPYTLIDSITNTSATVGDPFLQNIGVNAKWFKKGKKILDPEWFEQVFWTLPA